MKVLLTGGTGYIGSHTAVECCKVGYEVDILDNLSNSKAAVVDKIEKICGVRPKFHEIDLLDYEAMDELFSSNKYDLVLHFAGLKAVAESVEKPVLYYENNVGGTINLLKCMLKHGVKKIVFSSSATVYGEQESPKFVETMTTGIGITSPYGKTKYMIEEILKDICVADREFSAIILRYFNPVGNHETGLIGEDPNGIPNNLMPIIMKVASGEMPELKVYGNDYPTVDGTCVRDFIHVVDLAKGHVAAMDVGMTPGVSIYNLGMGKGTSVLEIIKSFEKNSGKEIPYAVVGRRAGDLPEFFADPTKAERELGWKAERTIDDAMRDILRFLDNE